MLIRLAVAAALASTTLAAAPGDTRATVPGCRPAGDVIRIPELSEASGVAASRRTPGMFWMHNDSGEPMLFAVDAAGTVKGRVRVTGAALVDWEDVAVGPCAAGTCLYLADIGDNEANRPQVTVYRVAEPSPADAATARVETFHATFPDGPHDAESLFVTKDAGVYVITKTSPRLFRFPLSPDGGRATRLEALGAPMQGADEDRENRPTGAAVSPNGDWVAVRTNRSMAFYRTADLTSGRWHEQFRVDLTGLGEPQGEGVTFATNDTLVLAGEAGGEDRGPGTLARLACDFAER
jgi:hypothetical protein